MPVSSFEVNFVFMDNVISLHVYYYMYMYLESRNVVVFFVQPIFTDTNLTESKFIFIYMFL